MTDSHDKIPETPLEKIQRQFHSLLKESSAFTHHQKIITPELEQQAPDSPINTSSVLNAIRNFDLKPKEIRDYLDRFVIKQTEAKKVLAVSVCDHYNHIRRHMEDTTVSNYSKQNILLLGPTGVGKTYLIRTLAKLIGVPFIKADATKFSETGYVGADVEDLVRDLVKAAEGNIELAQYGIIYIDEIDKIASETSNGNKDISGRGVQINLLKLMEDTEVNLVSPTDMLSQMQAIMKMGRNVKSQRKTINTRHILFIVSGAFDKLADSIRQRLDKSAIGFQNVLSSSDDTTNYLKQAITADFIKYGFEPEFVGRLPIRVACDPLYESDLEHILLSSEGSILNQYKNDFKGYDIEFDLKTPAIKAIAHQAVQEKTGARGLMTVLERIFRNFKYELPSTAVKYFEVTARTVNDPNETLKIITEAHTHLQAEVLRTGVKRYELYLKNMYSIQLNFDHEATDFIIQKGLSTEKTVRAICEDLLKTLINELSITKIEPTVHILTVTLEHIIGPEITYERLLAQNT